MKDLEKVSLAQEQFEKEYTQGIEEEGFYLSTGIGRDKKSKELTLELRIMPKEGKIEELQQSKIEVGEVGLGKEFGIKIKVKVPVKEGDVLEVFDETVRKKGA